MGSKLSTQKMSNFQLKWSKFIKSKTNANNKPNIPDEFIIQHLKENNNTTTDLSHGSFDLRRIVFISLMGLFNTYKKCPSYALYTSLIIIPLRRCWIYHPGQYINEIHSHFISQISAFSDLLETEKFIELLKWKDTQGTVFWMEDVYENKTNSNETLIDPVWFALNDKLIQLYDPVTKMKYKPLNLSATYWGKNKSKFGTKTSSILTELYFASMKFKSIQEIIYDSNPMSLNPIKEYGNNNIDIEKMNVSVNNITLFDEFDTDDDTENWFISPDYDPYDIPKDYTNCSI